MSEKGPGREKLAASQARLAELVKELTDLEQNHEREERLYQNHRDRILRDLEREPAYHSLDKQLQRAAAVREAHDQGDKLTIDGAFTTASNNLTGTAKGGAPKTMKTAHQSMQKYNLLKVTAAAIEPIWRKLRDPQSPK
jgi:hypothetical protein